MMPTWLYHQHFAMFPLNRHYNWSCYSASDPEVAGSAPGFTSTMDEIGNVIEDVYLSKQLIEVHKQDIEELESKVPVQLEDRMMIGNLTEDLKLIEKGLQVLKNVNYNDEHKDKTQRGRVVVYRASTPQVLCSINGLDKVDSAFHLRYIGSINEY
ncbi:hypothetical protein TNCV_2915351 [Trichonephila clavipes]|nr:hypothetical protein TNCV_2915351 [Trichonephila clavipes]